MELGVLQNLELLPVILEKVAIMEDRMKKYAPPVTTKKEVAKFLNKSQSTINRYMQLGLLVEGKHFYKKNGKILVFIEDAIFEFRDELHKGIVNEETKV